MAKKIVSIFLTMCIILSCAVIGMAVPAQAAEHIESSNYGLVDNVQYGQILQCWNWSFDNIRKNMGRIAEQGFTAIQTSPIQTSKESTTEYYSNVDSGTWVLYQPLDLKIETNYRNALGTKKEFKAMCEEADKYGVKVIVDTVFNHLASDMSGSGANPMIPSYILDDPDCWHTKDYNISNYDDRYDCTHNCLTGFPDLNTHSATLQGYAINFLKECIDCGADGFRFDAAKHIETDWDASSVRSDFWKNVLGAATSYAQSTKNFTPYYYGEVLGTPGGGLGIDAYTRHMSVTDNDTGNSIREAICNKSASGAARSTTSNGAAIDKVVQWNESHDTYYADRSSMGVSEYQLNQTWALVGSRNQVCGLYLARPYSIGTTRMGDADPTGWSSPEVQAINRFKNAFAGQSEYMSYSGSIVYNERGNAGAVLVNVSGGSCNVSVSAKALASGSYVDALTGNTFTVSSGRIHGNIGDKGIAVIYKNPSEVNASIESCSFRTDELKVTLSYEHATSGKYSLNGSRYVPFNNGDTITIGKGMGYGESASLIVTATGGQTTDVETYTYTKIDPNAPVRVYFDNTDYGWMNVNAYIYDANEKAISAWPGEKMTYDSQRGYYCYEVPVGFENGRVIFNNGSGTQYPGSGQAGYSINGSTKLFQNGTFAEYAEGNTGTIYVKPSDDWKSSGARFAAYVWNDTSTAWVDLTDSDGDGYYSGEMPEGIWKQAIIARLNPATTANYWENVWNQSADQTFPSGQNCFVMNGGEWDKATGSWMYYNPETYVAPATAPAAGTASDFAIVGSFNDWSSSANKMTYTGEANLVSTTVELTKGTYTLKVTDGTTWYGNSGTVYDSTSSVWYMDETDNLTLEASGGKYTFTYNTLLNSLSISSEIYVPVAIAGSFNAWSSTADVVFSSDNAVSITKELPAGTYTFKVVCGDQWYGNVGAINNATESPWLMNSSSNCTLIATGGTYTFTYYKAENQLAVSYVPAETQPTTASTAPTTEATEATTASTAPTTETTEATTASTAPTTEATEATTASTAPTTEATEATTASTAPTTEATEATEAIVTNYYLAGSFNSWSMTATPMAVSGTKATTTVTLEAGTYEFKVIDNGNWYGYNSTINNTTSTSGVTLKSTANNVTHKVTGGTYTFSYNTSTKKLVITNSANVTEPTESTAPTTESTAPIVTNYYLAGSFNNWSTSATPMAVSGKTATTTVTLEAGTYEFKVVDNGNWYGYNSKLTNKTSILGVTLKTTANNISLTASGGTYTFKYNTSTKKLVITYTAGSGGSWSGDNTNPTEDRDDGETLATEGSDNHDKCVGGHTYGKDKVTKKATYFATGKKVKTCSECGHKKTTTIAKLKLKKPTVKITAGKGKVTVKYTKVKGATGFQVRCKINGKTVTKTFNTKKSLLKVVKNLKKGNCKVQVRLFVKQGKKTAYSAWTNAKTVKVK